MKRKKKNVSHETLNDTRIIRKLQLSGSVGKKTPRISIPNEWINYLDKTAGDEMILELDLVRRSIIVR